MRSYNIHDLIPLEDFVRTSSLRFLTQVWRNHNCFNQLLNQPYVREINGALYTEDGNHRCLWSLINGITTINAIPEELNEDVSRITLLTAESTRRSGIKSFQDLVRIVENPIQYSKTGQITHQITSEDLGNPKYFLKI